MRTLPSARFWFAVFTMLWRLNMDEVAPPVMLIAVVSSTPFAVKLRAAERRKSWTLNPRYERFFLHRRLCATRFEAGPR